MKCYIIKSEQLAIANHCPQKYIMSCFCSSVVMSPLTILILMNLLFFNVKAETDCKSVLVSLSPCLNYVTGNSSTPTASCCSQLAAVVRSKPECLCSVLDGSADASLGISIDENLALQLPNLCSVKTPPVSKCDAAGGPSESTGPSPPQTSAAGGYTKLLFAVGASLCLLLRSI